MLEIWAGTCLFCSRVDMFKPWIFLASNTLAMPSSKTCRACHLLGLCISQSTKLAFLNWHALHHHLAERVNMMTCAQPYTCFFKIRETLIQRLALWCHRWRRSLIKKVVQQNKHWNDASVSPVIRQSLLHWAYELTEEDFERTRQGL